MEEKRARGKIIQINETAEKIPGSIDLDGEPPFGEVDLHFVRALVEASAQLRDCSLSRSSRKASREYPGIPSGGYIKLKVDRAITACLSGTWA